MGGYEDIVDWELTSRNPDGYSNRLYHIEPGCELPWEQNGYMWYRIQTSYWFGDWIETQDKSLWHAYGGRHRAIYVVREDLMTLIRLKWL